MAGAVAVVAAAGQLPAVGQETGPCGRCYRRRGLRGPALRSRCPTRRVAPPNLRRAPPTRRRTRVDRRARAEAATFSSFPPFSPERRRGGNCSATRREIPAESLEVGVEDEDGRLDLPRIAQLRCRPSLERPGACGSATAAGREAPTARRPSRSRASCARRSSRRGRRRAPFQGPHAVVDDLEPARNASAHGDRDRAGVDGPGEDVEQHQTDPGEDFGDDEQGDDQPVGGLPPPERG